MLPQCDPWCGTDPCNWGAIPSSRLECCLPKSGPGTYLHAGLARLVAATLPNTSNPGRCHLIPLPELLILRQQTKPTLTPISLTTPVPRLCCSQPGHALTVLSSAPDLEVYAASQSPQAPPCPSMPRNMIESRYSRSGIDRPMNMMYT